MEYYAKSKKFLIKREDRERILEKVDTVIDVLCAGPDKEILAKLQKYKEELLAEEKEDLQQKTLTEHLEDTVRCAEDFFGLYGRYFSDKEKSLILDACRLHDVGKANYIFQTKVNKELKNLGRRDDIPHGFLSAVILSEKEFLKNNSSYTKEDFDVLVTSIYYHHDRKYDFNDFELKEYCKDYYLEYVREYLNDDEIQIYETNKGSLLFSNDGKYHKLVKEKLWCEYMLVKGMLNKFDWTVSAGYERAELASDFEEKRLCGNVTKKLSGQFRPVQEFMLANKDKNVVVIAPTGSGKTEAALMWIDGEKGFYTLPLKVSSNAIYRRITENYGYDGAALLHSDSLNEYFKEKKDSKEPEDDFKSGYRNYEQAKLFAYPLTVCTVDQLFKFVYKALGTEIFAATLKYSKIVIDEIQSYSPRVVAALIFGLSEISRMGGKFAIITATFPPVLKYFMKEMGLLEERDFEFKDFSDSAKTVRHRIRIVDADLDIDEIADAASSKKVLVICNTVTKAQKVYQKIIDKTEEKGGGIKVGLLHSRFIRAHRDILEKEIMAFSANDSECGVWVTTQIVEASLDIDFDILYTEMCTADSLLQRMGRCNRAGRKDTSACNIIIFDNDSGKGHVYDKDIYDISARMIKKYDGMLFSEADKTEYINAVYDTEKIRRTEYFKQIEDNIAHFAEGLCPAQYSLKDEMKAFRDIESVTVIPDSIYNDNSEKIQRIGELLNTPHVDKSVRKLLKSEIAALTLSLHKRYCKVSGNLVDIGCISYFDIHRSRLDYYFDGKTGLGLVMSARDEDNFV